MSYTRIFLLALWLTCACRSALSSPPLLAVHDEASICNALCNELPSLSIQSCKLLMSGWDNTVVEVNGHWIFRFPRKEHMAVTLEREIKLLDRLQGKTSLCVPHYIFIGKEVAMVGYAKLQGTDFLAPDYALLAEHEKQDIAQSIAQFATQLHRAISFDEARVLGYGDYCPPLDAIECNILGALPSPELESMVQSAVRYARSHARKAARLALIHNDLHGENMAYNSLEKKIVGIFDFSDVIIADVAIEFAKLFLIDVDLALRTICEYELLTGHTDMVMVAATDYVIRRATYVLEFRRNGEFAKEAEMINMLASFLPLWHELSSF
ncbi:MAG: aminoglycoside phosphotransferase family protein [Candidatus Babeliales bacterium]